MSGEPPPPPLKQYLPMTEEEVWRFIDTEKLMFLATVGDDHRPQNTPVWYVTRDRRLYFRAQPYKRKIRNLLHHPWVAVAIAAGEKCTELEGVSIQATARIVHDPERVKEVTSHLMEKYQRERNYHEMPREWRETHEQEERVIVELTPVKIASWDNSKWLRLEGMPRPV